MSPNQQRLDAIARLQMIKADAESEARKAQRTRHSPAWKAMAADVYSKDVAAIDYAISQLEMLVRNS